MMKKVQLRIGRVTRETWMWPAMFASAAVPWALLGLGSLLGEWSRLPDSLFWSIDACCILSPFVPLAIAVAAWRRSGFYGRIGVVFAAAAVAIEAWAGAATLEGGAFVAYEGIAFARQSGPVRRAMRVPPELAAARALAAGDSSFLGIRGFITFNTPAIENSCVLARSAVRTITLDAGPLPSPAEARFRTAMWTYAERYNAVVAASLGVGAVELHGFGRCAWADGRDWPSER